MIFSIELLFPGVLSHEAFSEFELVVDPSPLPLLQSADLPIIRVGSVLIFEVLLKNYPLDVVLLLIGLTLISSFR